MPANSALTLFLADERATRRGRLGAHAPVEAGGGDEGAAGGCRYLTRSVLVTGRATPGGGVASSLGDAGWKRVARRAAAGSHQTRGYTGDYDGCGNAKDNACVAAAAGSGTTGSRSSGSGALAVSAYVFDIGHINDLRGAGGRGGIRDHRARDLDAAPRSDIATAQLHGDIRSLVGQQKIGSAFDRATYQ